MLKPKRKNKYIPLGMARNFDQVGINPTKEARAGGGILVSRNMMGVADAAPRVLVCSAFRGTNSHNFD